VRNDAFPASMGGPPRLARFVVAVVDEPTTKFAGLVSGELDGAGIAPTMAALAARDPALRVVSYPWRSPTCWSSPATIRRSTTRECAAPCISPSTAGGSSKRRSPATPRRRRRPSRRRARGRRPTRHALHAPDPARADALLDEAGWRRGADGVRYRAGRALEVALLTVGSGDNRWSSSCRRTRGARVRVRIGRAS
jgi:peptide/nickel transport system substrate-binding protein